MADIVINPAVGKIEFFSVKGDNVTNTLRLSGNTLLVTGPLSASSISTGGGGAFVTSVQPTANYLSKFTGNSTIANSLVYDNGTNIGIGTTSPAAKFIVNGGTVNTTTYTASETRIADGSIHLMKTVAGGVFESIRAMNADTTAGTTVRFLAASTSDPFNNANGGKVFIDAIRTSTNMDLAFSLNDVGGAAPVERVRFMGSGNVGIGTSNPTTKLAVSDGTTIAQVNPASGVAYFGTVNNYPMALSVNSSEKVRIFSGGSVSFGTSTDTLFSAGNIYLNGATGTAAGPVIAFGQSDSVTGGVGHRARIVGGGTSQDIYIQSQGTSNSIGLNANPSGAVIYFETQGVEKARITAAGNVGIGTTNPIFKFQVVGSAYVNAGTLYIDSGNSLTWGNSTQSILGTNDVGLSFVAGSATRMFISSGGNIGIGTTTTAARLHVNSTTAGATLLRTDGTSGTLFSVVDDLSDSLMSVNNSAGLPVLEVFADDRIIGGQYGQNDFVVVNNKLGIGTNNPTAKLQVTSSVSIPAAAFLGGNVGIGTTSPAVKLDVAGTIRSSTNEIYGFGASDNVSLRAASSVNVLGVYTSNTERVRVDANGNVGIGTSGPSSKLHVSGSVKISGLTTSATGYYLTVDNTTGVVYKSTATAAGTSGSSGSSGSSGTSGSSGSSGSSGTSGTSGTSGSSGSSGSSGASVTVTGLTNYVTKFNSTTTITTGSIVNLNNGNVGIGTTSPSSKLHVVETTATGSRIQLGTTSTNAFMDANKVNDFIVLTAPFGASPASVSNGGAKWGIKMNGTLDSINTKAKSACIYAVSEETGTGYNRVVGLALHTSGFDLDNAERVRITSGGNVGIGSTSPAAKLDIVGTNSTIALSFGTTVPNNPLFINTYGGAAGIGMDQATAGIRLAGDYSGGSNPLVDIGYYSGATVSHANWIQSIKQWICKLCL